MASHLIQDQNLIVHFNGASAGGKTNFSKVPRKGGLAGRKPLGDVSNSVKPCSNQAFEKQNSSTFSYTEKETGASRVAYEASKNRSVSKASEKVQSGGRKALTDISNSGRPSLPNSLKKSQNGNLNVLAEKTNLLSVIAEEQFLHNHQECIKARTKAMDMDDFLKTVGLDNDFSKQFAASPRAIPVSTKLKPENSLRYFESEEMVELLIEDQSLHNQDLSGKVDSPPNCRTPKSPHHYVHWDDNISFMLLETP
ncbi:hypothetical protein CFOL_v3_19769 [Cephalotus follicularis]|uniref:Uncharacterized protein n=1 Tax=Cephalotus follicularis TaxID=3775 RepID=A0A1Q3C7Z0_CEPFO|nr:hypothetical protein CFOL_v3_19769 [Cephalotus follicularis]